MDRLDMALDDIAKENRKKEKPFNGKPNRSSGPVRTTNSLRHAIVKSKSTPYVKPLVRGNTNQMKSNIVSNSSKSNIGSNGTWKHDLYNTTLPKRARQVAENAAVSLAQRMGLVKKPKPKNDNDNPTVSIRGAAGGKTTNFIIKGASGPTDVEVSNLLKGTTIDDVKIAFGECGNITRAQFIVAGKASVTFSTRSGADAAVEKFNNAIADGQVLKVSIVGPAQKKVETSTKMQVDNPKQKSRK